MVLPMWVFWLALIAMLIGLVGVVLPVVPGVGFIWIIILIYAVAERFATIDPLTFIFLTLLGAVGVTADLWMGQAGARAGGASVWSILVSLLSSFIGAIVGLLFGGIGAAPAAIIAAVAGLLIAEWVQRRNWQEAIQAGSGWLIGCALSWGIQLIIGLLMLSIFVWQALKG